MTPIHQFVLTGSLLLAAAGTVGTAALTGARGPGLLAVFVLHGLLAYLGAGALFDRVTREMRSRIQRVVVDRAMAAPAATPFRSIFVPPPAPPPAPKPVTQVPVAAPPPVPRPKPPPTTSNLNLTRPPVRRDGRIRRHGRDLRRL